MCSRIGWISILTVAVIFLVGMAVSDGILGADPEAAEMLDPGRRAGKRIAFEVKTGFTTDIFVMDADGSNVKALTEDNKHAGCPAWSPDGKRVAFSSNKSGNFEIYVMNADGSGLKNLTNNEAKEWGPAWSHDGRRIAFTRDVDGRGDIFVMSSRGGRAKNLTNTKKEDWTGSGAWSPNGKKIVFSGQPESSPHDIFVVNANGGGLVNLTNNRQGNDFAPAWSPDGKKIVYESGWGSTFDLFVINADGSDRKKLLDHSKVKAVPRNPAWSPDGKRIAFQAEGPNANVDVYTMKADGSDVKMLTKSGTMESRARPSWSTR